MKQPRLRTWVGETQQKRPELVGWKEELSSGWSWRLKRRHMITQGLETGLNHQVLGWENAFTSLKYVLWNLLQNNFTEKSLWLKGTGIYSLTVWFLETSHQGAGRTGFFWRLRKNPFYTFPQLGGSHTSWLVDPLFWLSVCLHILSLEPPSVSASSVSAPFFHKGNSRRV